MTTADLARALASERRLQILEWLKHPSQHFAAHPEGDLSADGVSSQHIARKLHVAQPTASVHLSILDSAGLVRTRRIGQWAFYRRDEAGINRAKRALAAI